MSASPDTILPRPADLQLAGTFTAMQAQAARRGRLTKRYVLVAIAKDGHLYRTPLTSSCWRWGAFEFPEQALAFRAARPKPARWTVVDLGETQGCLVHTDCAVVPELGRDCMEDQRAKADHTPARWAEAWTPARP